MLLNLKQFLKTHFQKTTECKTQVSCINVSILDHKNNIETTPGVDGESAANPVVNISVAFLWMQVLNACIPRKSLKFT